LRARDPGDRFAPYLVEIIARIQQRSGKTGFDHPPFPHHVPVSPSGCPSCLGDGDFEYLPPIRHSRTGSHMFNLGMIAGGIILSPYVNPPIMSMAIGVLLVGWDNC